MHLILHSVLGSWHCCYLQKFFQSKNCSWTSTLSLSMPPLPCCVETMHLHCKVSILATLVWCCLKAHVCWGIHVEAKGQVCEILFSHLYRDSKRSSSLQGKHLTTLRHLTEPLDSVYLSLTYLVWTVHINEILTT